MRRVFKILIGAAILVAIAWWIAGLPGEVAAQIGQTSYEASVPVTVLLLVVLFVVVYLLLRLLAALLHLPARARRASLERRRSRGDVAVTRALVALAAGEGSDARREVQRARRLLGDTPQTLLLASEASRAAGREDESEAALRLLAERQDAAFLGLRGLLRDAISRQDWEASAELARRAETAHPGASWLRAERWQLAIRTHAWKEALSLAPADAPSAAFAAAAAEAETDPAAARKLAKRAFTAEPGLPAAALAYARRLREAGRERSAQDVLRNGWTACPQPALAEFALELTTDKTARLRVAERLVTGNVENGESQLLLGRLSLEAGLLGEARRHAETATRRPGVWPSARRCATPPPPAATPPGAVPHAAPPTPSGIPPARTARRRAVSHGPRRRRPTYCCRRSPPFLDRWCCAAATIIACVFPRRMAENYGNGLHQQAGRRAAAHQNISGDTRWNFSRRSACLRISAP
jgi:HemY protein